MVKEAFQLENGPIGGIYSSPSNIEIGPEDILYAGQQILVVADSEKEQDDQEEYYAMQQQEDEGD